VVKDCRLKRQEVLPTIKKPGKTTTTVSVGREEMARILIADDDPDICSFLCRIVRKAVPDAQIDTARDGDECLDKLCSIPIDLALIDVQIPRLSGLDVMYIIRRKGLEVDIVLLSGWATAEMARRAARAGAQDLLEKPIIVHEIMGAVHHFSGKVGIPVGKGE